MMVWDSRVQGLWVMTSVLRGRWCLLLTLPCWVESQSEIPEWWVGPEIGGEPGGCGGLGETDRALQMWGCRDPWTPLLAMRHCRVGSLPGMEHRLLLVGSLCPSLDVWDDDWLSWQCQSSRMALHWKEGGVCRCKVQCWCSVWRSYFRRSVSGLAAVDHTWQCVECCLGLVEGHGLHEYSGSRSGLDPPPELDIDCWGVKVVGESR